MMAKPGLTNSDGCRENGPIKSQRVAPLISGPTSTAATISTMADTVQATARRRMLRGDMNDVAKITASAAPRKTN